MGKRGAATLPLTKQALEAASTKQAPKAVCSAAQRACACDHSARARAHHPPCAPLPAPPHLGTLVEATHCGWPPGSSCCLLRRLPCLPCTGEHMGSGCQWEQCASGSNVPVGAMCQRELVKLFGGCRAHPCLGRGKHAMDSLRKSQRRHSLCNCMCASHRTCVVASALPGVQGIACCHGLASVLNQSTALASCAVAQHSTTASQQDAHGQQ